MTKDQGKFDFSSHDPFNKLLFLSGGKGTKRGGRGQEEGWWWREEEEGSHELPVHRIHAKGNELRGQRSRWTVSTHAYFLFCFDWQTDKRGGPKKQTEREKKKTILRERRKELNIENLSDNKLRWRCYQNTTAHTTPNVKYSQVALHTQITFMFFMCFYAEKLQTISGSGCANLKPRSSSCNTDTCGRNMRWGFISIKSDMMLEERMSLSDVQYDITFNYTQAVTPSRLGRTIMFPVPRDAVWVTWEWSRVVQQWFIRVMFCLIDHRS